MRSEFNLWRIFMFATYAVAGALLIVARSLTIKNQRAQIRDAWLAIGLIAGAGYSLPLATWLTTRPTQTFDAVLYRADCVLGLTGQGLCWYANTRPVLWSMLAVIYQGIPLWVALVYVVERDLEMLEVLALGLMIAPAFYWLVPAVGPVHAFPGWPYQEPHVAFRLLTENNSLLPRNCFPSGHLMLAFVPVLYARTWRLRALALGYLALMVMATVGSGEHYVVDLLAAIPYS